MGMLVSALKSQMTRKHVAEGGDTAIATRGMGTSVKALDLVRQGNREGGLALAHATQVIGKPRNTQAATAEVAKRMGQVQAWADQMKMMKPIIEKGAKAYKQGSADQASMAKTIAQTSQEVAVLNSGAQYDMYKGHHAAQMQVAVNQSAYGGAGWSA